jgi:methyl-accepting chemotaxis protein
MKSIKYKILVSFCTIATISITALAVIVSVKISDSISQQAEKLAANMTNQTYETLNLPHQTFELLIREEIRRSVSELCQNPIFIANVESGRLSALKAELESTAKKDGLDFALLLNLKGQLQAPFPPNLDDFEVADYIQSWNFGAYIQNMLKDEFAENTTIWETFIRQDEQALHVLGLDNRGVSGKGALSIVAASIVKNDFDEMLGICLVGKLLNGYEQPLQRLHAIAGYASVLYLDTIPIVHAGFVKAKEETFDLATFQISSDLQTEVYNNPNKRTNRILTFAGIPYLSACSALHSFADEHVGILCVGLPESQITTAQQAILSSGNNARRNVQKWIVGIGVISLGFFALASVIIATRIVNPLKQLSRHAKKIATGDFQEKIMTTSRDEIGDLSHSLNDVLNSFREISRTSEAIAVGNLNHKVSLRSAEDTLGHALQYMSAYLSEMASMAKAVARGDLTSTVQVRSTDDVLGQAIKSMTEGLHALITQTKTSVEQLTSTKTTISSLAAMNIEIVEDVHTAVEHMTATMAEMDASVTQVSHNMDVLSSSAEETTTSVSQMATTITQIASNTTNLTHQAHQTIEFITQAVGSLENIIKSTDTSQHLAQGTIQDALEGQHAVEQVMISMQTIQQTITMAVESIAQFAKRSQEIDMILGVIREITDQTSLLALNASIIAAQAGTQGRGFAVVADEIKSLSTRVNASTKDIATIVKSLQQDTSRVVQAVHGGAVDVKQGMERTQQAQEALNKINASAKRSSTVVAEIADALHSLMAISHNISSAMKQVNTMTDEITAATNEHKTGTDQIHQAFSQINDMTSQIQQATYEQLTGVQQVIDVTHHVTTLMDHNLESSQQIVQITKELSSQAAVLLQSVDRFKLESNETKGS